MSSAIGPYDYPYKKDSSIEECYRKNGLPPNPTQNQIDEVVKGLEDRKAWHVAYKSYFYEKLGSVEKSQANLKKKLALYERVDALIPGRYAPITQLFFASFNALHFLMLGKNFEESLEETGDNLERVESKHQSFIKKFKVAGLNAIFDESAIQGIKTARKAELDEKALRAEYEDMKRIDKEMERLLAKLAPQSASE